MNNQNRAPTLEKTPEITFLSWNQIYNSLIKLTETIKKSSFKPDIIVGVSRGGLIPARIISDLLDNTQLATVTAEFYVGIAQTKHEPTLTQQVSIPVKDKTLLVVDDIADTGKSLKLVNSHLTKQGAAQIKTATIYSKPWSITVPTYCAEETKRWIVFPWEQKEAVTEIVQKFINTGKTVNSIKEKLISSGLNKELANQFIKEALEEKQ